MSKFEKLFNDFKDSVEKAALEMKAEVDKVQKAADAVTGGKIMPVASCKLTTCNTYNVEVAKNSGSWYFKPTWEQHVKEARMNLAEERLRIDAIHAGNEAAIENNKKVKYQLTMVMETAGVSSTYSEYENVSPRSTKKHWVKKSAGFMSDLDRVCTVNDNYAHAVDALKAYEKRINDYETAKKAEQAAEARKKEEASKKNEDLKSLAKLAAKYDCDVESYEVLEAVLAKNKYLRLAHYLAENREDWNDGPDKANTGLMGFEVSSAEDQKINEELTNLIENWDGDGRVFRDCTYNYTYLFNKAAEDSSSLMVDYNSIKEILDKQMI